MSLIKQFWLLLVATIVGAFMASFALGVLSARTTLETQLRLKNNDTAQSLALTLTQFRGDAVSMELAVSALFDTGYYDEIRLAGLRGETLAVQKREATAQAAAPRWFQNLVPIRSAEGVAQVSDGWKPIGSLHVVSQAGFAYRDLWEGSLRSALAFLALGGLAGTLGSLAIARLRRPLDASVAQAHALTERRFVTLPEPRSPEVRALTRAMNAMVERVRLMFDEQGGQVERLRREARCDPLTGVLHRQAFLEGLEASLRDGSTGRQDQLVLVRLRSLAQVNRELGHARVDEMLKALAARLQAMAVDADAVGRLNGSDFACRTEEHPGRPLPSKVAEMLQEVLRPLGDNAGACAAVVSLNGQAGVSTLMTAADAALVRAEAGPAWSVERALSEPAGRQWGEAQWRTRLEAALLSDHARLMSYRVVNRQGELVHLECPLRLELDAEMAAVAAAQWLPFAHRVGLMPDIDLKAVELALRDMADDRRSRGINIAVQSLRDADFLPSLRRRIEAQPEGLRRGLSLELPESVLGTGLEALRELCVQMRPLGVRVGLEHAGARLRQGDAGLLSLGLDFVKLDATLTQGLAEAASRRAYLEGLVSMLHGIGLQVYAEGVAQAEDAEALWAAGVDGITGPWVRQ